MDELKGLGSAARNVINGENRGGRSGRGIGIRDEKMTMHGTLKIVRIGLKTHYSVQAVSLDFLMLLSKDINFVGYTYKNFEIVNDYQVPGMVELKKKNTKSKRLTIKSLFEQESESSEIASQ
ncbi:hypothetical protein BUALT_Bualt05G0073600 [Buddleja alternifolia]|uniref:Uncharacterized protein n=1 Tax=Buddleja alternifolia TaxID=168488 RepID=A0AAV6XQF1_9LAMI|nr:hypothetical protein BUALT_Bualt05G0073600 [Buddleja alternifolia]